MSAVENSASASAPPQAANLASIFQKAYARAVALQRMDEQIAALLEQRQRLENDFREAQMEVNNECERMLKSASIAPAKILAQMAQSAAVGQLGDPLVGHENGNRLTLAKPAAAGVR
jgi:hypothetical protein